STHYRDAVEKRGQAAAEPAASDERRHVEEEAVIVDEVLDDDVRLREWSAQLPGPNARGRRHDDEVAPLQSLDGGDDQLAWVTVVDGALRHSNDFSRGIEEDGRARAL